MVEPQLASGRVHLSPEDFAAALPAAHAGLFSAKEIATPVLLPLQDVLTNVPTTALRMRDDQEEQERGSNFATPFSATADEDARRFNVAATPVPKPAPSLTTPDVSEPQHGDARDAVPRVRGQAEACPSAAAEATSAKTERMAAGEIAERRHSAVATTRPAQRKERTPLQKALATDEAVEPKMVVAHIEKMDGVEGCAMMFGDGLNLAGQLPESYEADGLCAMAPSLIQRIENHMVETNLGALRGMTLSCTGGSITFFMHDNLCLAALHKEGSLSSDVYTRLDGVVLELSKTYSQPA
jgi:predicted regulator of Ras-like GTPase activity (Roadblock/LC7/MglB family)